MTKARVGENQKDIRSVTEIGKDAREKEKRKGKKKNKSLKIKRSGWYESYNFCYDVQVYNYLVKLSVLYLHTRHIYNPHIHNYRKELL